MADVAGCQPAVLEHARSFFGVAPIAVHYVLTADHDLTVLGDSDLGVHRGRADRVEPDADARAITADHRAGLSLAVALEESDPKRLEEDSHLGVERCAARHPGLDPPADLGADLLAQREREDAVHRPVPRLQSLLIFV